MRYQGSGLFKKIGLAVGGALLVGLCAAALFMDKSWLKSKNSDAPTSDAPSSVKAITSDILELKPEVVEALGLKTVPVQKATQPRLLQMSGSLGLDTNLLARVRSRFPGEVMELGQTEEQPDGRTHNRPVDFGDKVVKGQLLAVIWSKDLGEKKSELVAAISQQRIHEENLKQMEKFSASLPERSIREAQLAVESDIVAVERARRTLRSWQLTSEEIQAIEDEADRLRLRKGKRDPNQDKDWARVEVRAPFAGTVLERNVAPRDIVDNSTDLFKVADLSGLRVWANVYEEDLPALQALKQPMSWTVQLKADPKAAPMPGRIDRIGDTVDPTDHTARVLGRVDNRDGRMKAGQFITATVELPPAADEMEIPTAALVEDGRDSVVFVQPDPNQLQFAQTRVAVVRRLQDVVFVRLDPKGTASGEPKSLRPGDRVVTAGALELKAALEDAQGNKK